MRLENKPYWVEQFELTKHYLINSIDDYFGKNPGLQSSIGIIHSHIIGLQSIVSLFEIKSLYEKLQRIEGIFELYAYDESEGKITPEYQKSINEELLELQEFLRHMELEE